MVLWDDVLFLPRQSESSSFSIFLVFIIYIKVYLSSFLSLCKKANECISLVNYSFKVKSCFLKDWPLLNSVISL